MAEDQQTDQKFQIFAQSLLCIIVHPDRLDDDEASKVGDCRCYVLRKGPN